MDVSTGLMDKSIRIAIVIHVYYQAQFEIIAQKIQAILAENQAKNFCLIDIHITLPSERESELYTLIQQALPQAKIHIVANYGMDLLPFFTLIPDLQQYDWVLKLHTKNNHSTLNKIWVDTVIDGLIGSPDLFFDTLATLMAHAGWGMAGLLPFFLSSEKLKLGNDINTQKLAQLWQLDISQEWGFFAGSFYWITPQILLQPAQKLLEHTDWFKQDFAHDGQMAHAVERLITRLVSQYQRIGLLFLTKTDPQTHPAIAFYIEETHPFAINQAFSHPLLESYQTLSETVAILDNVNLLDVPVYQEKSGISFPSANIAYEHFALVGQFSSLASMVLPIALKREQEKLFSWKKVKQKQRIKNRVSIIIPVFNEIKLTLLCLESIRKHTVYSDYEIIVVDNGSDFITRTTLKAYAKLHPKCQVYHLKNNFNFSIGCNYGFSKSNGEYVLFLNNDTEVTKGWLQTLVESLHLPNVAMVQPLLCYPDNTVQCAGIEFGEDGFGYERLNSESLTNPEVKVSQACSALTGACMLLRAEDFAELNGFDTWYINGQEDIDLCLKIRALNQNSLLWYEANSLVIHATSQSVGRRNFINQNKQISRVKNSQNFFKNSLNNLSVENEDMQEISKLKQGNDSFSETDYLSALIYYSQALVENSHPIILEQIQNNIARTYQRIIKSEATKAIYYHSLGIQANDVIADTMSLKNFVNVEKINNSTYHAATDDPYTEVQFTPFQLNVSLTLKLIISLSFLHSRTNTAKIYIDYGDGYTEEHSHEFSLISGKRKEKILELIRQPVAIRFDPVASQEDFTIIDFYLLNYDIAQHKINRLEDLETKEIVNENALICANNIQKDVNNEYISLNNDPHFIIDPNKLIAIEEGYYLITFDIEVAIEGGQVAKFYIDYGQGFSEKNILVIPYYSNNQMHKVVKFSQTPVALRFDPCEIKGKVIIHNFSINEITNYSLTTYFESYLNTLGKSITNKNNLPLLEYEQELFETYESSFMDQINSFFAKNKYDYQSWVSEIEQFYLEKKYSNKTKTLSNFPLMSFIVVINDDISASYLQRLVTSFKEQIYPSWQLAIIVDNTLIISENVKNAIQKEDRVQLISYNSIKQMTWVQQATQLLQKDSAKYISIIDKVGELPPYALLALATTFQEKPKSQFIYTDEDTISNQGERESPAFKPSWNMDWFLSTNYINNLWLMDIKLYQQVGGLDNRYQNSTIYQLLLKSLLSIDEKAISHLAEVHYHNLVEEKLPTNIEQLEERYAVSTVLKDKIKGFIEVSPGLLPQLHKVSWKVDNNLPKVSIIIPTKDKKDITEVAVRSVLEKTTYPNYEILIVDNQSIEKQTLDFFKEIQKDKRVKVIKYNYPFNYSAINNYAVKQATGEIICLLNNDIEVISPDWLTEMVSQAQRPEIGCVGAKLYYINNAIQHAGVIMGVGGVAAHGHRLSHREDNGYLNQLKLIRDCTAVTAACLVVKRSIYTEVGGLDEENFKVAYNDVDFCLKVFHKGYKNVWTPYAELYHYESLTRGSDADNKLKLERLLNESEFMMDKWGEFLNEDPNYNMNLSVSNDQYGVTENVEIPIIYEGNILYEWYAKNLIEKQQACVFVNFDKNSVLHEYVINYLADLAKYYDIYFVSTSDKLHQNKKAIQTLQQYCKYVAVRKNEGYDFGSWRLGIEKLETNLSKYKTLLLCNDSIYGPFFDLKNVIDKFMTSDLDVMGLTESNEIKYHLQSYFVMYKPQVFLSDFFKKFWHNIKMQKQKWSIITKYEIGLSQKLMRSKDAGFKIGPYCDTTDYPVVNLTHVFWKDLIVKHNFPFIKVELLRDNPTNQDLSDWKSVIRENSSYDIKLIEKHLEKIDSKYK